LRSALTILSFGSPQKLYERGAKVVGVPKTIDNDLGGTDTTLRL